MIDLSGQRILVLGGSSGIGLETARLAQSLGASVTIASRSAERIAEALRTLGPGGEGASLDLTRTEQVEAFFAAGPAWDHVIQTASEVRMAAVRELPIVDAEAAFDSKFWSFYRVARYARIVDGGSLSVIAGFLATRPAAGRALMGAINAALESLVQGLALELKPIRVNAVSPAVVESGMWSGLTPQARAAMFEKVSAAYPAGSPGRSIDIARQLLLLAATPYATGVIVTLDGGASIA